MPVELKQPPKRVELDAPAKPNDVLADAAARILREEVFLKAMSNLRQHYVEQLVRADPSNSMQVVELQATIRAVDGLNTELMKFTHGASRAPMKVI